MKTSINQSINMISEMIRSVDYEKINSSDNKIVKTLAEIESNNGHDTET